MHLKTFLLVVCLTLLLAASTHAQEKDAKPGAAPLTRRLQMAAVYVKESQDQAWSFKIVGTLPMGPGLYLIVYDEAANVAYRAEVPSGKYSLENPFTIHVPLDGKAQTYVIRMVGHQHNMTDIRLPLTDLPFEVYGDGGFAFGYGQKGEQRFFAFQSPADGTPQEFSGSGGHYRILDENGAVVADSKEKAMPDNDPKKKGSARDKEMTLQLPPGKTYWFEPYGIMYGGVNSTNMYVTFDPPRWFEPKLSWSIQSRPWWKGLVE